jgi:hypothetical protein
MNSGVVTVADLQLRIAPTESWFGTLKRERGHRKMAS